MDPRSKAIELVQAAGALILDFDGPGCDVFAGFPAADVAKELIKHIDFEIDTDDPLAVLRRAVGIGTLKPSIGSSPISNASPSRALQRPLESGS